jgi:hypothetical protein
MNGLGKHTPKEEKEDNRMPCHEDEELELVGMDQKPGQMS